MKLGQQKFQMYNFNVEKKQQKYLNNVLLPKFADTTVKFLNGTDLEKKFIGGFKRINISMFKKFKADMNVFQGNKSKHLSEIRK